MRWLFLLASFLTHLGWVHSQNLAFSGDKMSFNQRTGETVLEGRAEVTWDNQRLSADRITIMGQENKVVRAFGSVVFYDKETNTTLKSQQLRYDQNTKIVQAVGQVQAEHPKDNLSVQAGFLRYDEKNKLWEFESQVIFTGEDFSGRAERMRYDEATFRLELEGDAHLIRDEENFKAQFISIHTKNKELQMKGNITGSIRESTGGG